MAVVNTPEHFAWFQNINRLFTSDSCFFSFLPHLFFFFKQHFLGLFFLYSMLREWGGKLEILTSAFSVLILLMRFSCDPG